MRPIFIAGCPRSGTTLLGATLGDHSQCIAIPESQFKIECLRPLGMPGGRLEVETTYRKILEHWRFRAWDMVPGAMQSDETLDTYAKMIGKLVVDYGNQRGQLEGVEAWVDHTPDNLYNLETLLTAFPKAKIIHIIRDGRAVAASVRSLDWGPNTILGAGHYWIEHVSYGLAAERKFAKQIIQVRYEDLVRDPQHELKRLCAWLCLEFEKTMIRGEGFSKPSYYSYRAHRLIGKSPDASRAKAWENELKPRELEEFESVTGEFLQYLGYELHYGLKARKITGSDIVRSLMVELLGEVINRLRGRMRIRKSLY